MKRFKFLSMLLLMLVTTFSFAACSDDDDDQVAGASIVGSWVTYDWISYGGKPCEVTLTFKADRSGQVVIYREDSGSQQIEPFQYSIAIGSDGETYVTIFGCEYYIEGENVFNGRYKAVIGANSMQFGGLEFQKK